MNERLKRLSPSCMYSTVLWTLDSGLRTVTTVLCTVHATFHKVRLVRLLDISASPSLLGLAAGQVLDRTVLVIYCTVLKPRKIFHGRLRHRLGFGLYFISRRLAFSSRRSITSYCRALIQSNPQLFIILRTYSSTVSKSLA